MANLETSITWALYADRIRAAVGTCDPSDDLDLQGVLSIVTVWCDSYLANDFTDCDGNDLTIPEGVVYAVIKAIKMMFEIDESGILPGTANVRTRDLSQGWGVISGGFTPDDALYKYLVAALYPYRKEIWR